MRKKSLDANVAYDFRYAIVDAAGLVGAASGESEGGCLSLSGERERERERERESGSKQTRRGRRKREPHARAGTPVLGCTGPYSECCSLEPRSGRRQLVAPVVASVDGESATVTWSGGAAPFALQYADEGDPGSPWRLAAAAVQGSSARKKNLAPGRSYAFRVKPADEEDYVPLTSAPFSTERAREKERENPSRGHILVCGIYYIRSGLRI